MPQATLTVGARGSNVAQLHNAMLQLGIELPDSEIRRTFFGPATRQAVQQIQQAHGLPVSGEFDEGTAAAMTTQLVARDPQAPPPATTAAAGAAPGSGDEAAAASVVSPQGVGGLTGKRSAPPGTYAVHGVVQFARGGFFAGATVRAFGAVLRHEHQLGPTVATNASGEYRIEYSPADFRGLEADHVDLIVRVYGIDGEIQEESPTQFNVAADAQIDLVAGGTQYVGPSEYERVGARLWPALDGVAAEDITLADAQWLSQDTGLPADRIAAYALAAALAKSANMSIEVFYALLRGVSVPGPSLLVRPAMALAAALNDAIGRNIIPEHPAEWHRGAVARLQARAADMLVRAGSGAMGDLLTAAGVPPGAQQSFAHAYLGHPATTGQLWTDLTATLGSEAVNQLQTAMQWGVVSLNHPPLIAALTQTVRQPSDVARLSLADWRQTIDQLETKGQPAVPGACRARPRRRGAAFMPSSCIRSPSAHSPRWRCRHSCREAPSRWRRACAASWSPTRTGTSTPCRCGPCWTAILPTRRRRRAWPSCNGCTV